MPKLTALVLVLILSLVAACSKQATVIYRDPQSEQLKSVEGEVIAHRSDHLLLDLEEGRGRIA